MKQKEPKRMSSSQSFYVFKEEFYSVFEAVAFYKAIDENTVRMWFCITLTDAPRYKIIE